MRAPTSGSAPVQRNPLTRADRKAHIRPPVPEQAVGSVKANVKETKERVRR
jgi:hypothetical protein